MSKKKPLNEMHEIYGDAYVIAKKLQTELKMKAPIEEICHLTQIAMEEAKNYTNSLIKELGS